MKIRKALVAFAGTVALAGAATAGVVPAWAASASGPCTADAGDYNFVSPGTTPFYLGVPNKIAAGAAAELKPTENTTTLIAHCNLNNGAPQFSFQLTAANGTVYYLTTRDTLPGGNVTLEAAPAGGPFASQLWTYAGSGPYSFQNAKTGLYLRVRNGGPKMYQTVSTGAQVTNWNQSS